MINLASLSLLPPAELRNPITFRALPILFLPSVLLWLHAFLNLRLAPTLTRLAVLPVTLLVTLRVFGSYAFKQPYLNMYNQVIGIAGSVLVMKATEWCFVPIEQRPAPGRRQRPSEDAITALRAVCDPRGIHFTFGKRGYTPKEFDTEFWPFLYSRSRSLLLHFLLIDILKTVARYFGPIGTPEGGSIFLDSVDPPWRYILSTLLALGTGSVAYGFMSMMHSLVSLIAVVIFRQDPSSWPPLFNSPWKMRSVADFWTTRWHQFFRRCFIVFGNRPGRLIAGEPGAIVGAFLASGVMHEIGIRCMGRGGDWKLVVGYFVSQAVGILIESGLFPSTDGRGMGIFRRSWAFLIVVGGANLIAEAWDVRGAAGTSLFPAAWSPVDAILSWL